MGWQEGVKQYNRSSHLQDQWTYKLKEYHNPRGLPQGRSGLSPMRGSPATGSPPALGRKASTHLALKTSRTHFRRAGGPQETEILF